MRRRRCSSRSACAATACRISLTLTAQAASPTQPLLESIRVRRSSRPRTTPARSTGRPTFPRIRPTTRTPQLRARHDCRLNADDVGARRRGLALSVLMLTACSSGKAAPPVAHLAASSGATRRRTMRCISLASACASMAFRISPTRSSQPTVPRRAKGFLNKRALKSYPDGWRMQAITACQRSVGRGQHRHWPELHKHQPARVAGASRVGSLHPRARGAELPRPESHHRRGHAAARPEQELPEHPRGDPRVPVAGSSRRSQPGRIVGGSKSTPVTRTPVTTE